MKRQKEIKLSKENREFIETIYNPETTIRQLDELCKIRHRQNRIRIIYINTRQRGLRNVIH